MKALFSCAVWKRPWPNLEVVSMNLSSIFSRARRLWCTRRDWGSKRSRMESPNSPVPPLHTKKDSIHHLPLPDPFFHSPTTPTHRKAGYRTEQATGWSPRPHLPCSLTFLSVITRFLVPAMQPFNMTKSLFTSP